MKRHVFINCPFDVDYQPLFQAIVFTVLKCAYKPRCALEVVDSGGTRISKIEALIEQCSLGIHDISRTQLDAANQLPRFNMPLELGLMIDRVRSFLNNAKRGARRRGKRAEGPRRCFARPGADAPSTMLRMVPLPRFAGEDRG